MKTNLDVALALIRVGLPLPTDLTAALLDEGIDVSALDPDLADDTSALQHTTSVFDWV
jgi:hypothetical protein